MHMHEKTTYINAGRNSQSISDRSGAPDLQFTEEHKMPLSVDDARQLFEVDKTNLDNVMSRIRDMEEARLENEVPIGFLESYQAYIYPFSESYVSLLALRSVGFDIRTLGPVASGTEMYDKDLHDEVRTAVRPEEYVKIQKIKFRTLGHVGVGWSDPQVEPRGHTAPHLLGDARTDGFLTPKETNPFQPNKWHELLDTAMRCNVYFKHGNIFRPGHFAQKQSGLQPWHDQLLNEGVLQRLYMTTHLFHDIVYRHRERVKKTDDLDVVIYGLLSRKGFRPYGPEELVGFARTMILEVLEEHPEWHPDDTLA